MMMTEAIHLAIITSIAPTLMALAALVATLRTARKAGVKLDQIHGLTNSTLTAANKRIDELEGIVRRLLDDQQLND